MGLAASCSGVSIMVLHSFESFFIAKRWYKQQNEFKDALLIGYLYNKSTEIDANEELAD